jgi:coenzyme Q-binding protein COQ10
MKVLRISTPLYPPLYRVRAPQKLPPQTFRRRFIAPPLQTLTASSTLPYPSPAIYAIIADVPQYSSFLPYCTASTVTAWSNPDRDGRKWPEEAELRVGWGGIEETFRSRIYCVPGRVVEAVAGRTRTGLGAEEVQHHRHGESFSGDETVAATEGIFTHLLSRWTVRPFSERQMILKGLGGEGMGKEHTEVSLAIEFQFTNPIYSAMSSAVADSVAGVLIEAFEKRVREVLDGSGSTEVRETGERLLSKGVS